MKKIIAFAFVAAFAMFGSIKMMNSTVYSPVSKTDFKELSYYGQYNTYNNSYRTNYVRPYVTKRGRYVGGYYRS